MMVTPIVLGVLALGLLAFVAYMVYLGREGIYGLTILFSLTGFVLFGIVLNRIIN